ncbi:Transposable element Tcb1 transposase, partial [Stegodyphus mimosarum]
MPRSKLRSWFDQVSEFDRGRIVAYRECGLSFREIGTRVGRNQATVMRIYDRWMQEAKTDRRVSSHQPQYTTSCDDRNIVRRAVTDRSVTSRTIAQHIQSVTHHAVSARTIRRRLQQSGGSARRALLRLPLMQNHRRPRRQWCHERRMWTAEWNEIAFTDESRFCLQHHDGRIRVSRHRGERMLNSYVMHRRTVATPGIMVWGGIGYHSRTPLVRIAESASRRYLIWRETEIRCHPSDIRERDAYGRGSVCVWGSISLDGRTDLHVFPRGTVNGQVYRDDILDAYVRPYAGAIGDAFLLQDDKSRPHRAHIVDDYLQKETVMRMEWPARYPDLNPIEHVWDALGRRLAALNPTPQTFAALETALQEQWLLLPMELIDRIIEGITHRCICCIASRGDHIPY